MDREAFYANADPKSLGPLQGIRVLEATNYASGPVCGMILSDFGADSIKCEMPGKGDPNRGVPPFYSDAGDTESSVVFAGINRGKRGVTLDFRQPEGQALFRKLAAQADIIIENFTPGTMKRWGIGYEEICAVKPDIIYISISGFGQFGPLHHKKGFDPVGQAMGGLMSVTGEKDGRPLRAGTVIADDMAGWQAALGALAALQYRNSTGKGQWVDACLTDAQLYASSMGVMGAANGDFVWQRSGNSLGGGAPMNTYLCSDGEYVSLFAPFDPHWKALCGLMGREELIDDPRTNSWKSREQHAEFVDQMIDGWLGNLSSAEVVAACDSVEVVAAPVLGYDQIIENDHFKQRDMIYQVEHPKHGPLTHFGVADKFSVSPAHIKATAPMLGQHNQQVYQDELGLSEDDIADLVGKGVI